MNVKSIRWNPGGKATTTSLDALSRSFVTNIGYRFLDNSGVNDSADIITFTLIAKVTETTNNTVIEDIKTSTLDRGLSIHNIDVFTHNESPWGQVETESIPSNTLPSIVLQFLGDLHGVPGFPTSFPTSTNSTESLSIDKAFDILEEILIASEPATPIGVSEDSSDLPINVTSACKVTNNVINFIFNQVNGVTFTSAANYDQGSAIATAIVCYKMLMANKVSPSSFVDDFNSRSNLSSSINNDSIAESIIYEKLSNLNTVTQDILPICSQSDIVNPGDEKSSTADTQGNNSSNASERSSEGDAEGMYDLPKNSVIANIIGHEIWPDVNSDPQNIFRNFNMNNNVKNGSRGSDGDNDQANQSSKKYSRDDNDDQMHQDSKSVGENDVYDAHDFPIKVAITDIISNEKYLNFDNILQDDFLNLGVNNDIENRSYNNDNSHMSQGLKNGSRNDNDDHISQSSKKYSHDDDNHISQDSNNHGENDMYDINDSPINVAISDIIDNETDINFDNIDTNNNTKTGSHDNDNSRMSKYLKGGSHDNGSDDYDDKYMNQDSKISGESNMYNTHDLPINVEVVDTIDYGTHLIMMSAFLSTPDE